MTRLSELRDTSSSSASNVHLPSVEAHHGFASIHTHHASFSPYQRAYDYHTGEMSIPHSQEDTDVAGAASYPSFSEFDFMQPFAPLDQGTITFPSPCNCGPTCGCAGCKEHHPLTADAYRDPYGSCANIAGCQACLDQTILTLPNTEPLAPQDGGFDQWLEQFGIEAGNTALSPPTVQASYQGNDLLFPEPTRERSVSWSSSSSSGLDHGTYYRAP